MYSSSRPHLHLISIPRGIRARVRVRFHHYPNSHGTSCHGNLLFTRLLIGRELRLVFNPLLQGFWCSLPDVSKCNLTFPRIKTLFGALNFGKKTSCTLNVKQPASWALKELKATESHTHTDAKRRFILNWTRRTRKSKNTQNLTNTILEITLRWR